MSVSKLRLALALIVAVAIFSPFGDVTRRVVRAAARVVTGEPPPLDLALRAQWWRAQAEVLAEEKSLESHRRTLDEATQRITRACQPFPVIMDAAGEPNCGRKPAK